MDLDFENSNAERALGVIWNATKDTIKIRAQVTPKLATRRGIASQIVQFYDGFGIISPF